jgi:BRCA1-associated protein
MDISTQRVWDYAGDGYVHRLIQNEADGKVVELPSTTISARDDEDEYVPREKIDSIGREYSHLLTSQLDSQRMYFEEKIAQAADKASQASAAAEKASETARTATRMLEDLQGSFDSMQHDLMPALERDKDRAERRASKFTEMARMMEKQWKEEKTVNESLLERVKFVDAALAKLQAERDDLAEQNRDLTFYITSGEKLKEAGAGEDVVEGTVSVAEAPGPEKKRRGKGRK